MWISLKEYTFGCHDSVGWLATLTIQPRRFVETHAAMNGAGWTPRRGCSNSGPRGVEGDIGSDAASQLADRPIDVVGCRVQDRLYARYVEGLNDAAAVLRDLRNDDPVHTGSARTIGNADSDRPGAVHDHGVRLR